MSNFYVCHGCGAVFERSGFFSSPIGFLYESLRGTRWQIPFRHCGNCPLEGVRNAYDNGVKPAVLELAKHNLEKLEGV